MDWQSLGRGMRFNFPRPLRTQHEGSAGNRLLAAFLLWALLLQPGLHYLASGLEIDDPAFRVAPLIGLVASAWLLQRAWIRLPLTAIGFRALRDWSAEERWFLLQAAMSLAIVTLWLFSHQLEELLSKGGRFMLPLWMAIGLLWGVVQEWVYRGWLQTELQRRLDPWPALLTANLVFTFGPLHGDLFHLGQAAPVAWGTLLATFGIGLFFGWLYQRSGNLWLPALLHGLWPLNM